MSDKNVPNKASFDELIQSVINGDGEKLDSIFDEALKEVPTELLPEDFNEVEAREYMGNFLKGIAEMSEGTFPELPELDEDGDVNFTDEMDSVSAVNSMARVSGTFAIEFPINSAEDVQAVIDELLADKEMNVKIHQIDTTAFYE
jgi:acyl carrier protein